MNQITDQAMDRVLKLAVEKQYDKMMDELENLPPRALYVLAKLMIAKMGEEYFGDFLDIMSGHGVDAGITVENEVSEEQVERYKWLNSTKREREYLMSIGEENMTAQDWFDLRATDF